jgi:two-component system sensor kinase FixL
MKDKDRTKKELINELEQLRRRVAQLEHSEAERKQVEKALSEQKLGSIVESVPDIIYELDSNRKISFINKAVERLLGHSQKELVGKDILELVHPDDREKARYRMAERRRTGILARPEDNEKSGRKVVERRTRADTDLLEVRLMKRDKVPVHVLITSAEGVYKEGKFIGTLGTVGIAKDITERKRAEEELEKMANELERSNKELELFAYIVSHDLQEPLRKVQAFGDKLKIRYAQVLESNHSNEEYDQRLISLLTCYCSSKVLDCH